MPFKSPLPWLDVPNQDLWQFIYERLDRPFPDDHVILIDGISKKSLTFGQHREESIIFGQGLKQKWGWKKGDTLLLISNNHIDYSSITAGVHYAGGVFAASSTQTTLEFLVDAIQICSVKGLITDPAHLKLALEAADKAGLSTERMAVLDEDNHQGIYSWREIKPEMVKKDEPRETINPAKDTAYIVFTSGTTGTPKAVVKSHSAAVYEIIWGLYYTRPVETAWKGIRTIATFPYYLPASYLVKGAYLYAGVQNLLLQEFSLGAILQLTQEYKVTRLHVSPPLLEFFAQHPLVDKYDLSSVTGFLSSGSVIDAEVAHRVWDRLKIRIQNGYGTTEASALANTDFQEPGTYPVSCVGALSHNAIAKIVDRYGVELPSGRIGRMFIKYKHMTTGYLNDPSLAKSLAANDGYFETGDFALVTHDGMIYIHGRSSDAFHYNGHEIRPQEIERLLKSHRWVKDVVVKGEDGDEPSKKPEARAFIVLNEGVEKTEKLKEELIQVVQYQAEEPYWLHGGVIFVDAIPKSPAGKILRHKLYELAMHAN